MQVTAHVLDERVDHRRLEVAHFTAIPDKHSAIGSINYFAVESGLLPANFFFLLRGKSLSPDPKVFQIIILPRILLLT